MRQKLLFLLLGLFFSLELHAAKFANQFVEFELPSNWKCNLEGAEWVCQSANRSERKDAIIILAAKLKGDQDSLEDYLAYLQKPKSYKSISGKAVRSEKKYAKFTKLNDHTWVDSLHLESEIPGFYTRYLATVKRDIGVLVTYSINQDKYKQYLNDFENMVKTLRVFRKSGGLNARPAEAKLFDAGSIPRGISPETFAPSYQPSQTGSASGESQSGSSQSDDELFLLILIGAGAILFLLWRRRSRR